MPQTPTMDYDALADALLCAAPDLCPQRLYAAFLHREMQAARQRVEAMLSSACRIRYQTEWSEDTDGGYRPRVGIWVSAFAIRSQEVAIHEGQPIAPEHCVIEYLLGATLRADLPLRDAEGDPAPWLAADWRAQQRAFAQALHAYVMRDLKWRTATDQPASHGDTVLKPVATAAAPASPARDAFPAATVLLSATDCEALAPQLRATALPDLVRLAEAIRPL